jgi:hypothetical protein
MSVRRLRIASATFAAILMATAAKAGGWILPEGTGFVEPMVRYSFGDQSFPADSFSSSTHASANEQEIQLRLLGEHGLGDDFSLDYDLRFAFLRRSEVKKGAEVVTSNTGLQEQRIGLNYGLTQDADFADSIGIGLVVPGSSAGKSPALDSGRWAIEPVYAFGVKPGLWNLTGHLDVSSRVFLDGGAAQFRTHLEIGAPVFDGVHLAAKAFFVRTARLNGFNEVSDHGELYNLLRIGVEARFHLVGNLEPVLAYEDGIAGMGGHAEQRVTLGVKFCY